jgi:hypothetical protein
MSPDPSWNSPSQPEAWLVCNPLKMEDNFNFFLPEMAMIPFLLGVFLLGVSCQLYEVTWSDPFFGPACPALCLRDLLVLFCLRNQELHAAAGLLGHGALRLPLWVGKPQLPQGLGGELGGLNLGDTLKCQFSWGNWWSTATFGGTQWSAKPCTIHIFYIESV